MQVVADNSVLAPKSPGDSGSEDFLYEKNRGQRHDIIDPGVVFDEGGLRPWLTVLGASIAQFTTFGYINSFGVYQDFYVREYLIDFTPSQIGWIGGTQLFFTFSLGIVSGRAFDRGYFYHLMGIGGVFLSVSLFMLSLSHQNSYYQVFLTHGLCFGIACGLVFSPTLGIAGHYFVQKRPLAIGLISSGSALGAIIHPIMLNKLFSGSAGFSNGVRISAGMNTILYIISLLLMRTRLPPKEGGPSPIPMLKKLACHTPFVLATFLNIILFLGFFFPIFYIQTRSILSGVDPNLAFYSVSMLNAGSLLGRFIQGSIASALGTLNMLVVGTFALSIVGGTMLCVKSVPSMFVFAALYGFFAGGASALGPAAIAYMANDPSEIGIRIGIFFGMGGIVALFAPALAGALLTSEFHWPAAVGFSTAALVCAALMSVGVRYLMVKEKGKAMVSII